MAVKFSSDIPALKDIYAALVTVADKYLLLGLELGVKEWKLRQIEANHRLGTSDAVQRRLMEVLQEWRSSRPERPWSDVVSALRAMEESKLASEIEKSHVQSAIMHTRFQASDLPSKKLTQVNHHKMVTKFFGLTAKITLKLNHKMSMELDQQKGEERFQHFRLQVAGICNSTAMAHTSSVVEIFDTIRELGLWDLKGDPYDLLLAVTEAAGEEEETTDMIQKFQEDYYTQYLVATKIADYITSYQVKGGQEHPQSPNCDLVQLSVKLGGVNVDATSLAYLTDLWKDIKRCIRLPDLYSVLASVEEGCVVVIWNVPAYIIPKVTRMPKFASELLRKYEVIRMSINGVCFYVSGKDHDAKGKSFDDDDDPFSSPEHLQHQQISTFPPPPPPTLSRIVGHDVELVVKTPELYCPICLLVLRDPIQVRCCGKRFCQACLKHVMVRRKICPHCNAKASRFEVFEDKAQRQAILEARVCCSNKELGCGWTGELCQLTNHLNSDPKEGKEESGCSYTELKCAHCSRHYHRRHMCSCSQKLYTCPHCKNYSSTYQDLGGSHISVCGDYSEKQVMSLEQECDGPALSIKTPAPVFSPPPNMVMTGFTEHKKSSDSWYSPPFYSHFGGYKMCLKVDANGTDAGTHVSVLVCLMRGEYDNCLSWPFQGEVTIQLVNQRRNEGHIKVTHCFDDCTPSDVAGRVIETERATGWGDCCFASHLSLNYDRFWNTQYLQQGTLEFQITQVKLFEVKAKDLPTRNMAGSVEQSLQQVPPITVIMDNFVSHKMHEDVWYSPPFYTHGGGYKMCLRVDANGWGRGKGTHVSVSAHLMRGDNDDDMPWPFRGQITFHLVNQRSNEEHVTYTIRFDEHTPDSATRRVTEGELNTDVCGIDWFIYHFDLRHDEFLNTEYLKNDSLEFQITNLSACCS